MSALLNAFGNRRVFFVLLLGFSSGIPLALTGSTLQAWMTSENVDLTVIGIFSLVGLPYTIKYLWSPLMDRFVPVPGPAPRVDAGDPAALFLVIAAMAFSEPKAHPARSRSCLLVAFCSASQDIVVDAWRTEVLAPEELGPGAGVHILGYRVAMPPRARYAPDPRRPDAVARRLSPDGRVRPPWGWSPPSSHRNPNCPRSRQERSRKRSSNRSRLFARPARPGSSCSSSSTS